VAALCFGQCAHTIFGPSAKESCSFDECPGDKRFDDFVVISNKPRIYYFPNFMTADECDKVVDYGEEHVKPSQITGGGGATVTNIRSSEIFFLDIDHETDPDVWKIKEKVHLATKLPYENMESLQLQRYLAPHKERGGESIDCCSSPLSHRFGAFEGKMQQDFYNPHLDSMGGAGLGERLATVCLYLSDVEEGGETIFPWVKNSTSGRSMNLDSTEMNANQIIKEAGPIFDWACEDPNADVVKVKPKKGAAVLFYSYTPDGKLDPLTVHGGCPVKKGVKYITQQWIKASWHEPRYSDRLEAHWQLDLFNEEDTVFDKKKGTNLLLQNVTRSHLYVEGKKKMKTPKNVLKFADTVKLCSKTDASFMQPVKVSGEVSFSIMVKNTVNDDTAASISLKTADGNFGWDLTFASDGVTMSGPVPGAEAVTVPYASDNWNQVNETCKPWTWSHSVYPIFICRSS
jgi:prolyl 4-hydroxylase